MEYTPFAGLTALDENDPITTNGGSFTTENPWIEDHLLQVGAVTHRHDAHAGLPNPTHAPTGQVVASGGTLAASATYAVTYTVVDNQGGETIAAPAVTLVTGGQVVAPTIAPTLGLVTSAGIMPAGNYYYALTYTDGDGGETTLGPTALIAIPPGFASASVALSGLATELHPGGPVNWRLWRSYEGQDWHLMAQGAANTYGDGGFNPPDDPARPPAANTTAGTNCLAVTLPTAAREPALASGAAIKLYLAQDTSFANPSFYAQLPLASAGHTILITSEAVSQGFPPPVSTSLPGAGKIYPDTDMVWALKSPVSTPQQLPSGAYGDLRIALSNQHVYGVLRSFGAARPGDWTDLTQTGELGITVMASGVGDAVWLPVASGDQDMSGGSGAITSFSKVGGATMIVASGLLTTSDPTQTDAVLGGGEIRDPYVQWQTWGTDHNAPLASVSGWASWLPTNNPLPNLARAPYQIWLEKGWAEAGLPNGPTVGQTPQITYVNPYDGINQLGDTINIVTPSTRWCTSFYWDGSSWQPLVLSLTTGVGYSPTGLYLDWMPILRRRPPARNANVYAYQWLTPGPLPDGYKMRVKFHGFQHTYADMMDFHLQLGLVLNLGSDTQGLCYYFGEEYQGWTTRPKDLILDQNNWPPESGMDGLPDLVMDPGIPTNTARSDSNLGNLADLLGFGIPNNNDIWMEIWRIGNTAYGALYDRDPAAGSQPNYVSRYDTTGTPYAAGNAGYFGIVLNHVADQTAGVAEVSLLKATLLPTITLYNQHELIFSGSGGINVGMTETASGAAQVMISGGGIELAASGGSRLTGWKTYVEYAGSGGTGVAVQDMGGGSARVVISGGGGGGGGPGLTSFTASAGTASAQVTTLLGFAASAGAAVGLQPLGGGSAVVMITASGLQGPPGASGAPGAAGTNGLVASALTIAGSAGANRVYPDIYAEFAASGVGQGVSIQNLGGGSARVVFGGAQVVPKNIQASGYTFAPGDVGLVVESPSAGVGSGAIGYIIAPFSQSGIPVDSVIEVFQYGTGQIQIAPGAGVVLRSDGGKSKTAAQFATVGLRQRAQDEWVLSGDLA